MNKQQRSISFNSVSPFRKKSPPLQKVPISFGINVELQKRQNYLSFYNSSQDGAQNINNNNQSRNSITGQNQSNEEREGQSRLVKQKSTFNDIYFENLRTNVTSGNDSHSRRATSKLSNHSNANSKTLMKPPLYLHIKQRQSVVDPIGNAQNISFLLRDSNISNQNNPNLVQRNNSIENSFVTKNQQESQKMPKQLVNLSFISGNTAQLPPKNQKQTQFINDFRQERNQFQVADLPQQFNPIHFSFYHNYQNQNSNKQNNLPINNQIKIENEQKNQMKRQSTKENQQFYLKTISNQTIEGANSQNKRVSRSFNSSQNNTLKQNEKSKDTQASSPQKRYKKLQDPERILKYIEQKEIGFDTTPDILKALNIAQRNTDEQLINRKRQPLAPLPNRCDEFPQQNKTHVKHIQKFDITFNQIDEGDLKKYIEEKEEFLNQVEIQRYNERYNLHKDKEDASAKRKSREKNYKLLDKEQDSFENLHFSISQLDIAKSDSPNIPQKNKRNGKISPKIVISTKHSSFDQKYGGIQPIKKYYKEFDEYSVQQKNLLRTQEQSPLNNGFSGKLEKMKKQNDQLSKITNLLHQIQREDPIV